MPGTITILLVKAEVDGLPGGFAIERHLEKNATVTIGPTHAIDESDGVSQALATLLVSSGRAPPH